MMRIGRFDCGDDAGVWAASGRDDVGPLPIAAAVINAESLRKRRLDTWVVYPTEMAEQTDHRGDAEFHTVIVLPSVSVPPW